MSILAEIRKELASQMIFQSELASRMMGNTQTRTKDLSSILNGKREPSSRLLEEIAEGLGCEWKLMKKVKVMMDYLILDKGIPGYPGVYQVRGYKDGIPENSTIMLHHDLNYIREKLKERGMKQVSLTDETNPIFIEAWRGEELMPLEVIV